MKNVHLRQTSNPSKLHEFGGEFIIGKREEHFRDYAIYITNDESIKEGDWVYDFITETVYQLFEKATKKEYKIILTTDSDLIKNGIQEVPNEFLEWFIKNPECGEVEIERSYAMSQSSYSGIEYEIILPEKKYTEKDLIGFAE